MENSKVFLIYRPGWEDPSLVHNKLRPEYAVGDNCREAAEDYFKRHPTERLIAVVGPPTGARSPRNEELSVLAVFAHDGEGRVSDALAYLDER